MQSTNMNDPVLISTSSKHSYPIFLLDGDIASITNDLGSRIPSKRAFVIVDENVHMLHHKRLGSLFEPMFEKIEWYRVPSGEGSKSMHHLADILDFLLESGIKRGTPVVVVGGGVTGDLGGFAASIALRGVPFVQFPTTLLAMVDSSVGGKTGINHRTGKNLIGSFYQPEAVYVDIHFLSTLPEREWISGLGEVIKYAAIRTPALFQTLNDLLDIGVERNSADWLPIIRTCVDIKAEIVRADEKENGIRSWLNYGHTFAHAMEAASGYTGILHGEAVYLGMIAASHLSNLLGASLDVELLIRFNRHLKIKWPDTCRDVDQLTNLMSNDKKNTEVGQTFVILKDWGLPEKVVVHDRAMILKAWLMAMHDIS
jgi:3-dehydroquinate synthase